MEAVTIQTLCIYHSTRTLCYVVAGQLRAVDISSHHRFSLYKYVKMSLKSPIENRSRNSWIMRITIAATHEHATPYPIVAGKKRRTFLPRCQAPVIGCFAVPLKEVSNRISELQEQPGKYLPHFARVWPATTKLQSVIPKFMGDDRAERKGTSQDQKIPATGFWRRQKGESRGTPRSRRSRFRVTTRAE